MGRSTCSMGLGIGSIAYRKGSMPHRPCSVAYGICSTFNNTCPASHATCSTVPHVPSPSRLSSRRARKRLEALRLSGSQIRNARLHGETARGRTAWRLDNRGCVQDVFLTNCSIASFYIFPPSFLALGCVRPPRPFDFSRGFAP